MAMIDILTLYVVTQNTDLTEGRGPERDIAWFDNEDVAKDKWDSTGGVMGGEFGKSIYRVIFKQSDKILDHEVQVYREHVYGYRPKPDGNWTVGWVDCRDVPENDPEWEEYLRLKEKFQD